MPPESQPLTVEQENDLALNEALAEYRRFRDAFLAVFGPPGARTPHGTIILERLEKFTAYRKNVYEQDALGHTDIYRTGRRQGRQDVMTAIHNMIEWKESAHGHTGRAGAR